MPHATLPSPGFQAFILCGPGASLDTFTSDPANFPKALIPVANRPMVWYALDYCYRMGITSIKLITPPESKEAIQSALDTNPYLTSLPSPKPDIIAPEGLTFTSGTAEIFRFTEVQDVITQDFVILPCDIVSELDGLSLLEAWMVTESGLGGATGGLTADGKPIPMGIGGEKIGRRGGMGVWYAAARSEDGKKKVEESDFLVTTPSKRSIVPPPEGSLRSRLEEIVTSMSVDTLNDILEEEKSLAIRSGLIRKHGQVKVRSNLRDSHVYLFPFWVKAFMKHNQTFDSISEDVLGWWAKATWQDGLGDKLGLREILDPPRSSRTEANGNANPLNDEISITALSTTSYINSSHTHDSHNTTHLASRVHHSSSTNLQPPSKLTIPPILAYIHPSTSAPLTRTDTIPALLATTLRLAKLPPTSESASPFAHPAKLASPDPLPPQARVSAEDTLIDAAVTLGSRCSVKESAVGARCVVGVGARLLRCLLMEGVEVGDGVQMSGCVVGRRARVEGAPAAAAAAAPGGAAAKEKEKGRTVLWDCEIGHGVVVPWGTEARGEKFAAGGVLDEAFAGEGKDEGEDWGSEDEE